MFKNPFNLGKTIQKGNFRLTLSGQHFDGLSNITNGVGVE